MGLVQYFLGGRWMLGDGGGDWIARGGDPHPPTSAPLDGAGWPVATMLLAMVLVALPFSRVGEPTTEGVAYRAYFSADLMTHLSVVAELQKGDFPPQNPFYAGEPLGYYWLFFLFPALVGKWIGNQQGLLLTYLAGGILFAGLATTAARRVSGSAGYAFPWLPSAWWLQAGRARRCSSGPRGWGSLWVISRT